MSSNLRIGGLASGMDIDQLVSDLMKAQRMRLDTIKQKKQVVEWQQEDYRTLNNTLRTLRDNVFKMKLQGTYLTKKATSSNEGLVKVTASGSAAAGNYSVKVNRLADNAKSTSYDTVLYDNSNAYLTFDQRLTDPAAVFGAGNISFKINGKLIELNPASTTENIDTLVSKINGSGAGVTATYDKTLNRMFLVSNTTGVDSKISVTDTNSNADVLFQALKLDSTAKISSSAAVSFDVKGATIEQQLGFAITDTVDFTINGKAIQITNTDTIDSMVEKINSSGAGVTAYYHKTLNKMFIESTASGSSAQINFESADSDATVLLNDKLHLNLDLSATVDKTGSDLPDDNGQDAEIELNGVVIHQSANQFSIAGLNYDLTGTSSTETVNVTVSRDTDAVYDSIKSFVDLYNTTIALINDEITEKSDGYLPLTDDQREELSDDQEKQWEDKARKGILRNDHILSSTVSKMRSSMSSVVPGVSNTKYDILSEIGITTGDYSERGKLYIDETKLKDALSKDPDAVMELFTKSSDTYSQKGIAARLYDDLTAGINSLIDKAGAESDFSQYDDSILGKQIEDYDEEIDRWEERLEVLEDRYWKQFTAMEEAIQKMNSQSSWLSLQFGSSQ